MSTLEELLREVSHQIRLAFEEASKKYTTPEDIAQHREEVVKDFLRQYLPLSYQFGKGEIIDSNGQRSGQVDVIVCNQYHPFSMSESGRGLFFAEGVACAVEVKSDLSDKRELERGLRQIRAVKKLERKPTEGDMTVGSASYPERLRLVPAVLFAYQAPSLPTLKANIMEFHGKIGIPVKEQPDAVVVLDKGIIYNIKDPGDSLKIVAGDERKLGLVGVEWGDRTLARFLFYLSHTIPREVRMTPIIQLYSGALDEKNLKVF